MQITVFAHPNSKKSRVQKDLLGSLHIYVNQPPLEGKANKAVADALAEHLNIAKSQVKLIRGEKSKIKIFFIND
jgi:uncharacterized protein YggU (UPF0235/DUF167 family)